MSVVSSGVSSIFSAIGRIAYGDGLADKGIARGLAAHFAFKAARLLDPDGAQYEIGRMRQDELKHQAARRILDPSYNTTNKKMYGAMIGQYDLDNAAKRDESYGIKIDNKELEEYIGTNFIGLWQELNQFPPGNIYLHNQNQEKALATSLATHLLRTHGHKSGSYALSKAADEIISSTPGAKVNTDQVMEQVAKIKERRQNALDSLAHKVIVSAHYQNLSYDQMLAHLKEYTFTDAYRTPDGERHKYIDQEFDFTAAEVFNHAIDNTERLMDNTSGMDAAYRNKVVSGMQKFKSDAPPSAAPAAVI